MLKGTEDIIDFWTHHFNSSSKILYIVGKGFDIRMNKGIEIISSIDKSYNIKCLLIEFDEGKDSPSNRYTPFVEVNKEKLFKIIKYIETKRIKLINDTSRKSRRVGDRAAASIITDYKDLKEFTDIIIDISALPRGVFFSLIGKILILLDENSKNGSRSSQNLYVLTAENAKLDANIIEEGIDEEINYTHGFTKDLELSKKNPIVWFPMLGEGKEIQISKAYNRIIPNEICPVLPFPSKDPRRSDALISEYHRLIFEVLRVESRNIIYVHEQNPFEVYRSLSLAISNYKRSLAELGGCRIAISVFSSKLISIGALLASYEDDNVGILNVEAQGYRIKNEKVMDELNLNTELFLSWIYGEPYFIDKD